jgi:tetratricopeptide (TPR) repeat protein
MSEYQELFREALVQGKKRNYRESVRLLQKIVSVSDEIAEAFLYLGRSYHALGNFPQAVDKLRRFIRLRPDSAAGYFFLGRTYLATGDYPRAAKSLELALQIKPDLGLAKSLLGYIYLKLKRSSRAVALLGEAVKEQPDNKRLFIGYLNALLIEGIKRFREGYYEYAEEVFRFILTNGNAGILPHLYLGMIKRLQGEIEEALAHYRRASAISPADELIQYRIAMLLSQTGRHDEAAELFSRLSIGKAKKSGSVVPSVLAAERHLAKGYFERKEYRQALHHALEVLHAQKSDREMHLLAAECYRETGEYDFARNHFTRVFDSDRSHIGAHYGLALIDWQEKEYRRMLERLKKIERIDPGNETVHYYTVLCNWKTGTDPAMLLPVVQEAVRSFGPDIHLFLALAETYERGGYPEPAEKWYRKILLIDESNLDAFRGIISLFESGQVKNDMQTLFDRYLELAPEDHSIRRLYIHHLYENERYDSAIEKIEYYLSSRPSADDETESYFQRLRAICYRKTKNFEIAAELYRRLLKEEPKKEGILRSYLYCLDKGGKKDLAADTALRAVEYLPSPSAVLCLIAGVLVHRKGDTEKALDLFRRATSISPEDWRGHYNIGEIYRMQGMGQFAQKFFDRADKLRKQA